MGRILTLIHVPTADIHTYMRDPTNLCLARGPDLHRPQLEPSGERQSTYRAAIPLASPRSQARVAMVAQPRAKLLAEVEVARSNDPQPAITDAHM